MWTAHPILIDPCDEILLRARAGQGVAELICMGQLNIVNMLELFLKFGPVLQALIGSREKNTQNRASTDLASCCRVLQGTELDSITSKRNVLREHVMMMSAVKRK